VKLDRLPTPTDLMNHPQLAAIVALDTTLLMAMRAILAAHDDLLNDDFPRSVKEADYWADRMVYLGYEIVKVIEKYRRVVLQRDFPEGPDF
jgi:hypothetical protein